MIAGRKSYGAGYALPRLDAAEVILVYALRRVTVIRGGDENGREL